MKDKSSSKKITKGIKSKRKDLQDYAELLIEMAEKADADEVFAENLLEQIEELRRVDGDPLEVRKERHFKLVTKTLDNCCNILFKNSKDVIEQMEIEVMLYHVLSAAFYDKYGQSNWININELVLDGQIKRDKEM